MPIVNSATDSIISDNRNVKYSSKNVLSIGCDKMIEHSKSTPCNVVLDRNKRLQYNKSLVYNGMMLAVQSE